MAIYSEFPMKNGEFPMKMASFQLIIVISHSFAGLPDNVWQRYFSTISRKKIAGDYLTLWDHSNKKVLST